MRAAAGQLPEETMIDLKANPNRTSSKARSRLALVAVSLFVFSGLSAIAQVSVPDLVEVYWQDSRTEPFLGVTGVTVVDDSICRAQVSTDKVQFIGLTRGETVAFVWINDQRFTVRLRVVARPEQPPAPHLSQSALDALGNGFVGSSMQAFIDPNGNTDYFFLHHFDWQQQFGADRLTIHGQAQDSTAAGAPEFNANSLSIQYTTPHTNLELVDFPLTLNGGLETKIAPYSSYNMYVLRGADFSWKSGQNQYEFFGGTTLPPYYLTLSSTRDVAGFNFSRKESDHLLLYTTTGWVNAPFQLSSGQLQRDNSFFQTAGLVYHPNQEWALQGSAGGSTRGALAQGTVNYSGERLTAFVAGTSSSPSFPLNQLQLFFAGGSSISTGATLKLGGRIAGALYYQHSDTKPTAFFPIGGKSDYLNPNLSFSITPGESLTLNYTYTRNSTGISLTGRNQGHRLDVLFNSRLPRRTSNTAEVTSGSLSDPLQLNAAAQFVARDAFSFPVKTGYITVDVEHTRQDPSLVNRLNQELSLLPPALQQLFLDDPLAFVNSPELDPALRALLQNLQPTDTQYTVSGQFRLGERLNLSPNVAYFQNASGLGHNANSKLFGYSLSYQVTPTFQLVSSLSNVFLLDSQIAGVRRTTVFTVGFNKGLRGTSRLMLPFHPAKRSVSGRVFRDLNVNGVLNKGEPGLAGVRVDLSTGASVRTDAQGFYEFKGLTPDAYRVSVPLNQFTERVRVTTSTDVRVELLEARTAEVDFGIVNFARVIGNVFNDYRLDGKREPDASGVRAVKLTLSGNGVNRRVSADGGGDFEIYEVPPGDYQLTLDRSTLPPNYIAPTDSASVHVEPTATVIQDMPAQALRSVSGHVFFKSSVSGGAADAAYARLAAQHTAQTSTPKQEPPKETKKVAPKVWTNDDFPFGQAAQPAAPKTGETEQKGVSTNPGQATQPATPPAEGVEQPKQSDTSTAHPATEKLPSGAKTNPTSNPKNAMLQPLAGVQLTIDHTTAITGADGSFVLRNLPADELTLTLVPTRPLPPGLAVPSGRVKLPREPIQVENATIIISNPELLKYLLPEPATIAPPQP